MIKIKCNTYNVLKKIIEYKIKYRLVDKTTCIKYKTIQIDENCNKVMDATIIVKIDTKFKWWTGHGSNGKSVLIDLF